MTRRNFSRCVLSVAGGLSAPRFLSGQTGRPNVLWIMSDEQRPDSLGCYGSSWAKSPNLDRFAREGALFENAYTPSPVCVPARCCLLTGQFGSSLGVLHNRQQLRGDAQLLTWAFEDAGFRTASFGKKHYFYPGRRQAFEVEQGSAIGDVIDAQDYGKYDAANYDVVQYPGGSGREKRTWVLGGTFPESTDQTAEARNLELARQWLSGLGRNDRFLLRLSLNAPHTPVVVPKEFAGSVDPDAIHLPLPTETELQDKPAWERQALRGFQGAAPLRKDEILKARRYYYDRVAFLDHVLGRFLEWMEARRLLDNTVVAFTSDHGTHLGDQGLLQKQTFYEQVATVPYFFWWRGMGLGERRFATPVNTHTLLPTVMDLAGLELPPSIEVQSLKPSLIEGHEPPNPSVFSELKLGYQGYRDDERLVMVRKGHLKLSQFLDPRKPDRFADNPEGSLYDLENDPDEARNLIDSKDHASAVRSLTKDIEVWDRSRTAVAAA